MFGRSRERQAIQRGELDIAGAREVLAAWETRAGREGADARVTFGNGVGRTAGLLAERFGVSLADALAARHLESQQMHAACVDMSEAFRAGRRLLQSPSDTARTFGEEQCAGTAIVMTLYRMRVLSESAPLQTQRDAAHAVAEEVAAFARTLAEIAAGIDGAGSD